MAITVSAVAGKVIHIGRAGEHLATTVTFDVSEWLDEFGTTGTFVLYVKQGSGFYIQSIRQPTLPVSGTQWVFNNTINIRNSLGHYGIGSVYEDGLEVTRLLRPQVNFLSNGNNYSLIDGKSYYNRSEEIFYYDGKEVYNTGHWIKPEYKTIIITGGVDYENAPFLEWLNENATSTSDIQYFPSNGLVEWDVTNSNTGTIGLGKCELQYNVKGAIVKSMIYDIVVTNSLDMEAQEDPPDPIASWLNDVGQLLDDINNAAKWAVGPTAAATEPTDEPTDENNAMYWANIAQTYGNVTQNVTAQPGAVAAVTCVRNLSDNSLTWTFTLPQGEQGEEGPEGPEGPQGPPGTGLQIAGLVATQSNLPSSFQPKGTIYAVGSAPNINYYIQNSSTSPNNWGLLGSTLPAAILVTWTST